MKQKPVKLICGAVVACSFFAANYAAQHTWPLWSITLAGAVFLGAVLAYVMTMQSR